MVTCDLKHNLLSNPGLSYCDMVSDAIVCMCVKLEAAFYGHTFAAELF